MFCGCRYGSRWFVGCMCEQTEQLSRVLWCGGWCPPWCSLPGAPPNPPLTPHAPQRPCCPREERPRRSSFLLDPGPGGLLLVFPCPGLSSRCRRGRHCSSLRLRFRESSLSRLFSLDPGFLCRGLECRCRRRVGHRHLTGLQLLVCCISLSCSFVFAFAQGGSLCTFGNDSSVGDKCDIQLYS